MTTLSQQGQPTVVTRTDLPLPLFSRGKVRDTYDLGDALLMVATDRVSAFDVVMANGIPDKGAVLTGLARYWFRHTADLVPNHLLPDRDLSPYASSIPDLDRRSFVVRTAERIDVECVVRGYLAGSGWGEYTESGTLAGEPLAPGLRESDRLPEPRFTPAMKNDSGHDENISRARLADLIGHETAAALEEKSITLYRAIAEWALARGIILADTKFEFGWVDGALMLIDEIGTPDSSRFWPADRYEPGRAQESYDKQPLRDYLVASGWDKSPPGPELPPDVVAATSERYRTAYRLLTGQELS